MKILLTGVTGQVGWELRRSLMPLGEVVALDRAQCDLLRPEGLAAVVSRVMPDVIVNAAAYTAVDKAEHTPAIARVVNADAVAALGAAAARHKALFVHYSTDYVFGGRKASPYTEDDATMPINAYGSSKLAGERAIAVAGCAHLILRTTWVYAARGQNFLSTMLRLFAERERVSVVNDQFGAPTWARNIADATALLIAWAQAHRRGGQTVQHCFHVTAAGETSWHGFAEEIRRLAAHRWPEHPWAIQAIESIPADAYPTPARRPENSRLDCTRLKRETGIVLPPWQDALARCIEERAAP